MNYYNEFDPKAAAWIRELIAMGLVPKGEVDERSIEDVRPVDIRGFTQCHFFAGIGGWSYALRLAGWPDDRPVWTGSCPCQSFSAAGKRGGFDDERHLWPAFFWLIEQCRPGTVMGEQVASKDGLAWLDLVLADLEGANYTAGAVDLCAAGVGAPHIRQRLYWRADTIGMRRRGWDDGHYSSKRGRAVTEVETEGRSGSVLGGADSERLSTGRAAGPAEASGGRAHGESSGCSPLVLGSSDSERGALQRHRCELGEATIGVQGENRERERFRAESRSCCEPILGSPDSIGRQEQSSAAGRLHTEPCECSDVVLGHQYATSDGRNEGWAESGEWGIEPRCELVQRGGDTASLRLQGHDGQSRESQDKGRLLEPEGSGDDVQRSPANGFWRDARWHLCRDGKYRPWEGEAERALLAVASRLPAGVVRGGETRFPLIAEKQEARAMRLKGYGNAIVPQLAAEFIMATEATRK